VDGEHAEAQQEQEEMVLETELQAQSLDFAIEQQKGRCEGESIKDRDLGCDLSQLELDGHPGSPPNKHRDKIQKQVHNFFS
jgi:hypothetical protein